MSDKKPVVDRRSWLLVRRLARDHLRPYWWAIAAALACMSLAAVATASLALLLEPLIDEIIDKGNVGLIYTGAAIGFGVFALRGFASLGQHIAINWSGQRIIADMQARLYRHIIHADLAFFHSHSTGSLISRLLNDITRLRYSVSDALTGFGLHFFTAAFLVAVMIYQDWRLTLAAFVLLPLAAVPVYLIGRRMRRVSREGQAEIGRLTTFFDETFRGARHVKAYAMEEREAERAKSAVEGLFRLYFRGFRTEAVTHPVIDMLGGLAIVAVMLYGADQVIGGEKSKGAFVSFVASVMLAYNPVKQMSILHAKLQEGLAAADRIFEALDVEPRIVDAPDAKPIALERGAVRFEDVHFAYAGNVPALSGVTLDIPAGKTVALVGPSGSGKSTIMNLIPRFYDVDDGRVLVDGQDVREVTLRSLRASIGLVSQEISLFDDTVRANIAYGRPGASDDEIIAAAKQAAAHEFVEALPQGYDTPVGGEGVKLSGGQRQRIAIARAMLKNAPILLLDEATSALDTQSERAVQTALGKLMAGRTTLVIAHRLSTVYDADLIYVIREGRVAEVGTHRDLIALGGSYAQLYAMQHAETGGGEEIEPGRLRPAHG